VAQLVDLRAAMAELLAAYEGSILREQDGSGAGGSFSCYVPATERRRLHVIDQLKQLLADNAPAQEILQQVPVHLVMFNFWHVSSVL
jgi:hypothetical protein